MRLLISGSWVRAPRWATTLLRRSRLLVGVLPFATGAEMQRPSRSAAALLCGIAAWTEDPMILLLCRVAGAVA